MKMLKNGRNHDTYYMNGWGCSCCNTKQERRKGKKSAKRKEERNWRKESNA